MENEKQPQADTPFLVSLRQREDHQLEPLLRHYASHPETVAQVFAEMKARAEKRPDLPEGLALVLAERKARNENDKTERR